MSKQFTVTRLPFSIYRQIGALALLSGLCSLSASGQGLGNSPYSTYGVGETFSGAFASQQMMGNSGVSYSNGLFINNLNPALIARNRVTTLEVGGLVQSKQLTEGGQKQTAVGGNLGYLAMAFPLNSRWTASVNYTPYSYLDYSIKTYKQIPGSSYFSQQENNGSGGLNKVSFVNGFRVWKNLYAGAGASFLFGNMTREQTSTSIANDGNDYKYVLTNVEQYRNFMFRAGLAYRARFSDKRYINFGAAYDFPTYLRTSRSHTLATFLGDNPIQANADTLNYGSGRVNLPSTLRVGVSYENPYKLAVSADFVMNQWSQFRDFDRSSQNLKDSYQVNVGVEYTPNVLSSSDNFSRIPYRFGISHTQLPYTVSGIRIVENSVTFGLGLPLNKIGLSDANLGFSYGVRGKTAPDVIKEKFFRVILGFTISDRWFYRQVVD